MLADVVNGASPGALGLLASRMLQVRALLSALCLTAALSAGEAVPPIRFAPFAPVLASGKPLAVSYFSLVPRSADQQISLWFDANMNGTDIVVGLPGATLSTLQRVMPAFDGTLVKGYDRDLLGRKSPIISRSTAVRLKDGSYVVSASIGPEYGAGGKSTELFPVLFTSPDGKPGSWTYLGPPAGEPAADLARRMKAGQLIRSDGGALIQQADGSLRLYLHWDDSAGLRLVCMEAKTVVGPWTFIKDKGGKIRNLVPDKVGGSWLFPSLCPVPGNRLLLTGGNKWPPTELYAAMSLDGLDFKPVAATPVLTPAMIKPDATTVKMVRFAWNAAKGTLDAVANPWDKSTKDYPLYFSEATLASGLLPKE
jgi:hypothetical protein